MKNVTDTTYIYRFKHFLNYYLLMGVIYLSDCFNFFKIDGGGVGCDAQLRESWCLSSPNMFKGVLQLIKLTFHSFFDGGCS